MLKILLSIKSMSDFLIILIKDMDFFAQKTNKKTLKLDNEKVKVSSLVTFCQNITETLIKKYHKDRLRFILGEENVPDYIYTDEVKLKQILINLLSNSVKFSNTGYVKLKLNYNNLSEDMDFIVEDTGKGIAPDQKEKLFKPFVEDIDRASNPVGAGLGSYIVKELVALFDGGELSYESEVGKGTTFLFKSKLKGEYILNKSIKSPIRPKPRYSNSSVNTLYLDYCPKFNYNSEIQEIRNNNNNITNTNINNNPVVINVNQTFQTVNKEYNINLSNNYSFEKEDNLFYVILVDDEAITRKSTKRLIENYFLRQQIKIVTLEASDGIECLFIYYQLVKQEISNCFIISDESMYFINGSLCAQIIENICRDKNIEKRMFYLVTAYENFSCNGQQGVQRVFSKPLINNNLDHIKNDIFLNRD
jgi:hypothetical protein